MSMTDEEIKQNAEIYAKYSSRANNTAYYAYIEGAHSRDEEIEELEKRLEDMTRLKNVFASSLDIYDRDNRDLQNELTELRNKKGEQEL